jgi:hypothetical protein
MVRPFRWLTTRQRIDLQKLYDDGIKVAYLAAQFEVDPCTVRRIVRNAGSPIRSVGRPRNRGSAEAEV